MARTKMQNFNSNAALKEQVLDDLSLEFNVRRSISVHTEFRFDQIVTQSNAEKYFDPQNPTQENSYLNEVFEAMTRLNKEGMTSADLGKLTPDGDPLSAALDRACAWFAQTLPGRESNISKSEI